MLRTILLSIPLLLSFNSAFASQDKSVSEAWNELEGSLKQLQQAVTKLSEEKSKKIARESLKKIRTETKELAERIKTESEETSNKFKKEGKKSLLDGLDKLKTSIENLEKKLKEPPNENR